MVGIGGWIAAIGSEGAYKNRKKVGFVGIGLFRRICSLFNGSQSFILIEGLMPFGFEG